MSWDWTWTPMASALLSAIAVSAVIGFWLTGKLFYWNERRRKAKLEAEVGTLSQRDLQEAREAFAKLNKLIDAAQRAQTLSR